MKPSPSTRAGSASYNLNIAPPPVNFSLRCISFLTTQFSLGTLDMSYQTLGMPLPACRALGGAQSNGVRSADRERPAVLRWREAFNMESHVIER